MILSSQSIKRRAVKDFLITPFFANPQTENGRSYGLSACGYDVRLAQSMWLWPFWGRLGSIMEHIRMPLDCCAEVKDKSTNARLFILVQNTIIEPGWVGYLTVELTRFKPWPVFIRKGTPIAQVVFKLLDQPTDMGYNGKYQNQGKEPVKARMQ